MDPQLSLIVTTYTEARLQYVEPLLESVGRQTLKDIEVIFVGEGSQRLCEEARRLSLTLGLRRFEVILNTGTAGLSGARNAGLPHATGQILAFVDDDVVLFPDWAEELVNTFAADRSIIGVAGSTLPMWEDPTMAWLPEEFYWLISCTGWFAGYRGLPLRNAWGANMAFRREAFAHGLFDEQLGGNLGAHDGSKLGLLGEDTVFSLRVRKATGRPIVYNPDVRAYHRVAKYRLTPRYVKRRAFWEGYTKATLRRELAFQAPESTALERGLLSRIFLKFLPRTFLQLFRRPALGGRRIGFALSTLFYVALGYGSARFTPLDRVTRPRFGR